MDGGNIHEMKNLGYQSRWTIVKQKKTSYVSYVNLSEGVCVGTCGAGGSIAVVFQLNEDEQEGEDSEDRQAGGGPVQKAARVFLLPIVAADEASVSGFISA